MSFNNSSYITKYKLDKLIVMSKLEIKIKKQFKTIFYKSELAAHIFNKFISEISTLDDLYSVNLNSYNIKPLKINARLKTQIIEYNKNYKKMQSNKNFTPIEEETIKILDELSETYEIYYFNKFIICKNFPLSDNTDIIHDIYVILIHNNNLYQFVIEFNKFDNINNLTNGKEIEFYKIAIMKQYFSFMMKKNILRIFNCQYDVINQLISYFIEKMLLSNKFTIINEILPMKKYLNDEIKSGGKCIGRTRICTSTFCNKCIYSRLIFFHNHYSKIQTKLHGENIIQDLKIRNIVESNKVVKNTYLLPNEMIIKINPKSNVSNEDIQKIIASVGNKK